MPDHIVEIVTTKKPTPTPYMGLCACGQNSGWKSTRAECEKWRDDEHLPNVERTRRALSRRTPCLADQYNYYVEMSENLLIPERQRQQWALLAAELRPRVSAGDHVAGQDSLF